MKKKFRFKYYYPIVFVLGILFIFYTASYFVDIRNVLGIRDKLVELKSIHSAIFNIPLLWNYLFSDGAPVEIMQWTLNGLLIITSAYIAGILRAKNRMKEFYFWMLFAVLGLLMILEDAGNIRHFLTVRVVMLFWEEKSYRIITELVYFSIVSSVSVIAIIKFGPYVYKNHKRTAYLLLLGCVVYGIAVVMGGTRDIRYWYQTAGEKIYEFTANLGGEELREIYENTDAELIPQNSMTVAYRFMDSLLEESIQLIGAGILWASSLSYREYLLLGSPDTGGEED